MKKQFNSIPQMSLEEIQQKKAETGRQISMIETSIRNYFTSLSSIGTDSSNNQWCERLEELLTVCNGIRAGIRFVHNIRKLIK